MQEPATAEPATEQEDRDEESTVDVPVPEDSATDHEVEERDLAGELERDELPAELQGRADDLAHALEVSEVPAKFPEETTYPSADQPEAIGQVLIDELHPHLEPARIWWIYRQSLNRNKTPIPGRMQKSGRMVKARSGFDYTLNINFTLWVRAGAHERIRVVDELLEYADRDEDGAYGYQTPDVVTHTGPLVRWGLRDEAALQEVIEQLELGL